LHGVAQPRGKQTAGKVNSTKTRALWASLLDERKCKRFHLGKKIEASNAVLAAQMPHHHPMTQ